MEGGGGGGGGGGEWRRELGTRIYTPHVSSSFDCLQDGMKFTPR